MSIRNRLAKLEKFADALPPPRDWWAEGDEDLSEISDEELASRLAEREKRLAEFRADFTEEEIAEIEAEVAAKYPLLSESSQVYGRAEVIYPPGYEPPAPLSWRETVEVGDT